MFNKRFLSLAVAVAAALAGMTNEVTAEYRYRKALNGSARVDLCPSGWVSLGVGTSCYRVETATRDWPTARAFCQSQGGDLVTVSSAAEHNAIGAVMRPYTNYWIGLDDQAVESTWVTTRPEGGAFTAWGVGEPNNAGGNEDCVQGHNSGTSHIWNDLSCTGHVLAFICER